MRPSRLVTVLVTAGLLGLPMLVVGAAPATAAPPYTTKLLIDSVPSPQAYGGPIQVAGALVANWDDAPDPGEYAVDGELVYLQRLLAGSSTWQTIASATTQTEASGSGVVRFDTTAVSNATYRLFYAGGTWAEVADAQLKPVYSAVRVHKVARNLNAKAKELRRGFRYHGKVSPQYKRKTVVVQRNKGNGWRKFDKIKTNGKSKWSIVVPGKPSKGKWRYRAFVKADSKYIKSYARHLVVCTNLPASKCK